MLLATNTPSLSAVIGHIGVADGVLVRNDQLDAGVRWPIPTVHLE